MAQLTSQCTNTIYRWQFKRCGSPQQDKGQAVPGGCSLPGCSRGLGRGVSAELGCGWGAGCGWGCVSPAPKMQACLRKSGPCSERYVIEVKCKQLAEKGCIQPRLPPSRAWRGERREGGDRVQHLPCSIYLQTLASIRQFPEQSPQHQKRWGELPANAESPWHWESALLARGLRSSANYISANVQRRIYETYWAFRLQNRPKLEPYCGNTS